MFTDSLCLRTILLDDYSYGGSRQTYSNGVYTSPSVSTGRSTQDDIYSAVIMSKVIARVYSVNLMNVEQRQAAADPQTKPPDLGWESDCRLLSSTTTIAIYYYYSARKLILIYRPMECRRLS